MLSVYNISAVLPIDMEGDTVEQSVLPSKEISKDLL